jgi:hypothetical protein
MKEFEIDCYEVRESDGDGRSDHHICFCSSAGLAELITNQNKGWRSTSKFKKRFLVLDSEQEYKDNTRAAVKKRALSKLTEDEKEALGI